MPYSYPKPYFDAGMYDLRKLLDAAMLDVVRTRQIYFIQNSVWRSHREFCAPMTTKPTRCNAGIYHPRKLLGVTKP